MTNQTPNFFKRHKVAIIVFSIIVSLIIAAGIYQIVIWYDRANQDYRVQEIRKNNQELIKDYDYIGRIRFYEEETLVRANDKWQELYDEAYNSDSRYSREKLEKYDYDFWRFVEDVYDSSSFNDYYVTHSVYYKNGSYYVLHEERICINKLIWFGNSYSDQIKYTHFQVLTKGGYKGDYSYGTHRLGNDYYVRLDSKP